MAVIRQAMLINYQAHELAYMRIHVDGFQLDKFAPFIHENNVLPIVAELETAIYHIERNGNSRVVLTDLSIKLTRLLHKKAAWCLFAVFVVDNLQDLVSEIVIFFSIEHTTSLSCSKYIGITIGLTKVFDLIFNPSD